jgi:hypothetical protein
MGHLCSYTGHSGNIRPFPVLSGKVKVRFFDRKDTANLTSGKNEHPLSSC